MRMRRSFVKKKCPLSGDLYWNRLSKDRAKYVINRFSGRINGWCDCIPVAFVVLLQVNDQCERIPKQSIIASYVYLWGAKEIKAIHLYKYRLFRWKNGVVFIKSVNTMNMHATIRNQHLVMERFSLHNNSRVFICV